MTHSLRLPVAVNHTASVGLNSYMRTVNATPVLTAEKEHELAVRYREEGDLGAAKILVLSHLRHVVKVARGFMGYGLPLTDLIQEGSIGLMKAVKRYDPKRDVRLVSFAIHWIRAEIYDYVLRNWRMVKIATTKAQRKLFFNLRKSRERLGWMSDAEVEKLANDLRVASGTVREMEGRLSSHDVAFDALSSSSQDSDDSYLSPSQRLGDSRYDPENIVSHSERELETNKKLDRAFQKLDKRSRDVVSRRWLCDDKPTLHELANEYGVSAERIRQIEKRAMEKMKSVISI